MSCVCYCRVSSLTQNEYNKGISLNTQEQICAKFAHENKMHVRYIIKEIHSAYNRSPKLLNDIIKNKNQTIIISTIDRYSRSVSTGCELANKAIQNKNKIVFIQEKFVCESKTDIDILNKFLVITERESFTIGNRIKKAKTYLINNGFFAGGVIPYGYDVVDKKLVLNDYEQMVIDFIKLCMKNKITCIDLNRKMLYISKDSKYEPINCYDKNGDIIHIMTESLKPREIADLLNSYGVLKRGILWCPKVIKTAIKEYNPKVYLEDTKLNNWEELKTQLENIPITDITVPNNLSYNFEKLYKEQTKEGKKKRHLRRSSRFNPYMNTSHTNNNKKNNDIVMKEDVNLFKQFTEFQKFKKYMDFNC